ncbi:MAG TPA: nucleotidyltransferase family protein, partial [Candidatus Polarisedimenticolia bacterium]|nr:nucleotidyltransferase family protein [Candidatus Polarisedimenticolia bacterium]
MPDATTPLETRACGTPAESTAGLLGLLASPRACPEALERALSDLPGEERAPLLERIAFHRIDGLAHRALEALPRAAQDPWLRPVLKRRYQRLAAATLAQGLALAELLEAFDGARVPVLVMRGLRSVEGIYGDPGLRPFEDHDLMVPPAAFEAARAVLNRQGFAEPAPGLHRRGGLIVDLHVDPLGARRRPSRQAIFPIPVEGLFARALPGLVAGAPALRLAPEDEMHLLAIHLVKHSFDRLIRIADLAHLMVGHGQAVCWEALRRRAEESRTLRLVGWALEAATLLGAAFPAAFRPAPIPGAIEAALMRRVLELRPLPYTGEVLMACAARRLSDRVLFLMDALLPAGEVPADNWSRAAALPRRTAALARGAVE